MIKYDPKLESIMRNVVGRYNSKVNRLAAKNATHLPPLVTVDELKSKHVNRSELFRELKQLDLFGTSGMEDVITTEGGVKMTRWEFDRLKADVSLSKRRLTANINKQLNRESGFPSERVRTMSADRNYLDRNLRKMNYSQIRKLRRIAEKQVNKHVADQDFKNAFLEMLRKSYGSSGIFSTDEVEALVAKFSKLTPEQLADAYNDNYMIRDIVDRYHGWQQLVENERFGSPEMSQYSQEQLQSISTAYDSIASNIDQIVYDAQHGNEIYKIKSTEQLIAEERAKYMR